MASTLLNITITWLKPGGNVPLEVFVSSDSTLEMLKLQLCSITGIPPERMRIVGLKIPRTRPPGRKKRKGDSEKSIIESYTMEELSVNEKSRLSLMGSASENREEDEVEYMGSLVNDDLPQDGKIAQIHHQMRERRHVHDFDRMDGPALPPSWRAPITVPDFTPPQQGIGVHQDKLQSLMNLMPQETGLNVALYESVFGPTHPTIHQGSYVSAVKDAKNKGYPLILYLHPSEGEDSNEFCSKVLPDDHVIALLNSSFVFYIGFVGNELIPEFRSQNVRIPSITVLGFDGSQTIVLDTIEPNQSPVQFVSSLSTAILLNQGLTVNPESIERRELVDEQNRAYEESLRRDQERERKDERKVAEILENKETWEDWGRIFEREETSNTNEKQTIVAIRLPDGTRSMRSFNESDLVEVVKQYAGTLYYKYCLSQAGMESRAIDTDFLKKLDADALHSFWLTNENFSFTLVQQMPPKPLSETDNGKSLAEMGLVGQVMLLVIPS